jgi:putative membrane protein
MSGAGPAITRGQWAVLIFTLGYVGGFAAWFLGRGNYEFILYILTMAGLIALVGLSLRSAAYPLAMLWALTLWGLAHMAGGGVPVRGSVLYNLVLVPISGEGEMRLLKYDQLVHAYGFGVTAWLLWHLMARHYPVLRGSWTIYVYPALAAMGLGAVNEIIEFTAVLLVPDTNVGGYYNTALDLVFNALGAVTAVLIIAAVERRQG